MNEDIFGTLNQEQQIAVTHGDGPLLIVAGAGTGKTTVITRRIAWLILSGKCKVDEILGLTFTEKAAGEMEERVDRLLPYGYVNLWISTFHAFCERILKAHALDIGLPNDFKLLNQTTTWLLIRNNLDRFNLDYYRPLGNPTKFIHALIKHFSRAKDEEVNPAEYLAYAESRGLNVNSESKELQSDDVCRIKEIADAYYVYEQILLENDAMDFGGLISSTLQLFRQRPTILERYRSQFKYILVDEFQDTNWAQYELVKLLAAPKNNLTVVGDDQQSVYKFRGASLSNILEFKNDFEKSKEVFLVKNYRSTQNILDLAYASILHNNPNRLEYQLQQRGDTRLSQKLIAHSNDAGTIEHMHCATLRDEARAVIKKIVELKETDSTLSWGDFAILARSNDGVLPFINECADLGFPYQFLALKGLYAKSVILDVLAYFRLLDNYHESPSLYRILQLPIFDVSAGALVELNHAAHQKGWSLWQASQKLDVLVDIGAEDKERIRSVVGMIEKHTGMTRNKRVGELFLHFLHDTGYLKHLKSEEAAEPAAPKLSESEAREGLSCLNQMFKKIQQFQFDSSSLRFGAMGSSLKEFMTLIALEQEAGDSGDLAADVEIGPEAIKIMTIHASKGLEFAYVFVVNMVDRRFPTIEREDAIELPDALVKEFVPDGDIHLQEERRLFYVALTRAKRGVFLSSATDYGGSRKKKLSQFLIESGFGSSSPSYGATGAQMSEVGPPSSSQRNCGEEKHTYQLPSVFSFTQLASFRNCPLQYKFAILLKIPVFGKAQFSFGKTIHLVLQYWGESVLKRASEKQSSLFSERQKEYTNSQESPVSREDILEYYKKVWIDDWYPSQRIKEEYFVKGQEIIKAFYKENCDTQISPAFIEQDFTIKVGGASHPVSLKGRIDRIDTLSEGVEIIDYKTGTAKDGKSLTVEQKEQLTIYQIAVEETLGKRVEKLTYYYLEDGKKVSFLATPEEKQKIKERILKTVDAIRNSDFYATPGWHCQFCDYKAICEFRKM